MGIAERKEREKEDRRRLILDRAKELILERGVPALSMQDIADAAELSKATLYLYFPSKEALLSEILDDAAQAFTDYVETRIAGVTSGLAALRTLWGSYLSLFGESADIFVLTGIKNYSGGEGEAGEPVWPKNRMVELIARVLASGVADGTLMPELDTRQLAETAMTIAMAIIDNVARRPRDQRDVRLIRAEMKMTFELLLRGLAAPGTDRALMVLAEE